MQRFTNIRAWQRSHALALDIYRLTDTFPPRERFGITAQLRRSVTSVAANIAEGAKRRSQRDYGRLLNIAEGSLAETEALLTLSRDLGLATAGRIDPLIGEAEEISRMLNALYESVVSAR